MNCQHQLCWYELIPLISFLGLRGRCKVCKSKISKIYPAVELTTALTFAGLFFKFQDVFFSNLGSFLITYAFYAVLFSLLIVIAFYDLRHKIIPDRMSLLLGLLSFIGLFLFNSNGFYPHMPSLTDFASGLVIALPFFLFWLLSKGTWMGLGDAKLAVGLGWLLGLSRVLSGVVLSFWMGAAFGIILIFGTRQYGMKSEIPFAPFLVFGSIVAFLFELHIFPI